MRTPWKSVLGLALLAPLVGEFLLGNVAIREIGALILLAPFYGGGALLVREVARRTGKGWPTLLVLGLAYGLAEAGIFDGSLFSTAYEGVDYDAVRIPVLGVSAFYGLQFVVNHAVWSIGIPILLTETLTSRRRTTPWLGRFGLAVTIAVYLAAGLLIRYDSVQSGEYHVTWAQGIGVAAVALVLIWIALLLPSPEPERQREPRPSHRGSDRWVPRPWLVGVVGFGLSSTYLALPATWQGVVLTITIVAVAAWLIVGFGRRAGWQSRHEVALAGGALMTYAWAGFLLTALKHEADPVAFTGNGVFTVAAAALVALAFRCRSAVTGATQEAESSRKA